MFGHVHGQHEPTQKKSYFEVDIRNIFPYFISTVLLHTPAANLIILVLSTMDECSKLNSIATRTARLEAAKVTGMVQSFEQKCCTRTFVNLTLQFFQTNFCKGNLPYPSLF